jgi:hypothetical protein
MNRPTNPDRSLKPALSDADVDKGRQPPRQQIDPRQHSNTHERRTYIFTSVDGSAKMTDATGAIPE